MKKSTKADLKNTTLIKKLPLAILIVVLISTLSLVLIAIDLIELFRHLDVPISQIPSSFLNTYKSDEKFIYYIQLFLTSGLLVAGVAATVGLLSLKKWGWTLTMFLVGIGLAINILSFSSGQPTFILMLARIVQVILLDQEPVRSAFEENHDRS